MALVFEKVPAGERPGKIDFKKDGMVVEFPFHNPQKIFFDPAELLTALQEGKKYPGKEFHINYVKSRVEIVLKKKISGHNRMKVSKEKLLEALMGMYPGALQ